jgi:hypothetical protein
MLGAAMGDSGAPVRWNPGRIDEIRSEAVAALSDASSWKLADERWQEIYRVLAAMAAALESGDPGALEAATARLELAGPLRIIPIGPAPGPTPPVRDLLNELVHALGGVTVAQSWPERGDTGAAGAGSARG